jgi:glycosyltransferase involved in cell wall biosynthesis
MRRLLHVIGDSQFGGGAKIVLRLAMAGREWGWDVSVLSTNLRLQEELRSAGVESVALDCIWRYLRRERYDLVHTHTSKAGFVGRIAARMAGVPRIVHTVHGFSFHEGARPATVRFYSTLEKIAARFCDRIVTVSEFHRRWALELGIGRRDLIQCIPNGIPDPPVDEGHDRERIRTEFGLDPTDKVLISAGRIAEGKGLEDLLAAVVLLREHGREDIKVLLPGTGPSESAIRERIKALNLGEQVILPGFREDIPALLRASDVAVLPSLREGLSIALLEAMAVALPIVASSIGSNVEVTRQGEAAVLVPVGEPEAIATGVANLLESPDRRRVLGQRAREIFLAEYLESVMLGRYRQLYGEMLKDQWS